MTTLDSAPGFGLGAAPALTITVQGEPAGQGRISFNGRGRGARHSNEAQLKPWRKAIIDAAHNATGHHTYLDWNGTCARCQTTEKQHALYVGIPMAACITITVEKPKTAPKRRRTWPITRYSTDIDHHARACLDALSKGSILQDDSQVVELTIRKVYPGEHPSALGEPGALIRIWEVTS